MGYYSFLLWFKILWDFGSNFLHVRTKVLFPNPLTIVFVNTVRVSS